jgi:hypothetical protein
MNRCLHGYDSISFPRNQRVKTDWTSQECLRRVWDGSWRNAHGLDDKKLYKHAPCETSERKSVTLHFWELEREQRVRKCGGTTIIRSKMAMVMPAQQFTTPSPNFFRLIAILEQWFLGNEGRRRCPTDGSLRVTGSRSTAPILAAVAPRLLWHKGDVRCLCVHPINKN